MAAYLIIHLLSFLLRTNQNWESVHLYEQKLIPKELQNALDKFKDRVGLDFRPHIVKYTILDNFVLA